jgi:hypothetical protein
MRFWNGTDFQKLERLTGMRETDNCRKTNPTWLGNQTIDSFFIINLSNYGEKTSGLVRQ